MHVLLFTPPFTQLNTPYPATAYIKGFLNTQGVSSYQSDLGIEVVLRLFSAEGLRQMFANIALRELSKFSENAQRIIALKTDYIRTIDDVVAFLQGKKPTLAHLLAQAEMLPEASRFAETDDLDWAFGAIGVHDRAKHRATLYLEDLADCIKECLDGHFGFSRYAERLGRSAATFDELYATLHAPPTYIDNLLFEVLESIFKTQTPDLVAITVPFPGNLYAAFRTAQWIKQHAPTTKIVVGGGFPNTELRSLSDARVFEFWDFITLDDGEAPLHDLLQHLQGKRPLELLKRTFALDAGKVTYFNHSLTADFKQAKVGTPDYTDLPLDRYISVLEVANPMHRLWSDGRWNKLTMAHGCYWGKCTFCDISLDYIKLYEPVTAALLCDRMEEMMAKTGENGFHFVDEAAPPALMRALALEILARGIVVTWWANIRFEKSFTADLCVLLKASGCIAVSGGLEVASDRLLALIDKGVTVAQVARVTRNFTQSGIMVHAYLMYGFPTQTAQETIDSLEMVRQMFAQGIVQSAFWHQFAMTAHSPVGLQPEQFKVQKRTEAIGTFANNDIEHIDPTGADHESFSFGLKKSLFNYMHDICFDYPLQKWFDFKVPKTSVSPNFIVNALNEIDNMMAKPTAKIVWLGGMPSQKPAQKQKKAKPLVTLTFQMRQTTLALDFAETDAKWLLDVLPQLLPSAKATMTYETLAQNYETANIGTAFPMFFYNQPFNILRENGLLVL